MQKEKKAGMEIISVKRENLSEYHITACPLENESLSSLVDRFCLALEEKKAHLIKLDVFGKVEVFPEFKCLMERKLGRGFIQPTWLDSEDAFSENSKIAGMYAMAIADTDVDVVACNGLNSGVLFNDGFADYCYLGGVVAGDTAKAPGLQTSEVLNTMDSVLKTGGMDFLNIVRTWFFNDDILGWYDDFNEARTAFFKKLGVFDNLVPASTGIGGANQAGSALQSAALAIKIKDEKVKVAPLASPLQCPAPKYGSSFSRALEIETPDLKRVTVSGTASIEPGGKTANVGDVKAQMDLTFKVIEAILKSRELGWENVVRATTYLKDFRDKPLFMEFIEGKDLALMPFIVTNNAVCRDDLLFEVEVDALREKS